MSGTDNKHIRRWELAALLALSFCLCACVWAQGRQNSISASLLRLHVIAATDAPEEQALKLRVRDAVLAYLGPELRDVGSVAEAGELISSRIPEISQAAASAAQGRSVTVELKREYYPTKHYQGFALPAGSYKSLRISLGEAQGHNWWCIVFPPVCLSAAQRDELCKTMAPGDYAIVCEEEGYELRFMTLELWGRLKELLEGDS